MRNASINRVSSATRAASAGDVVRPRVTRGYGMPARSRNKAESWGSSFLTAPSCGCGSTANRPRSTQTRTCGDPAFGSSRKRFACDGADGDRRPRRRPEGAARGRRSLGRSARLFHSGSCRREYSAGARHFDLELAERSQQRLRPMAMGDRTAPGPLQILESIRAGNGPNMLFCAAQRRFTT